MFFLRFQVAETQVLLRAFESALARNGKEWYSVGIIKATQGLAIKHLLIKHISPYC